MASKRARDFFHWTKINTKNTQKKNSYMTKTANFCRVRPANCYSGVTTDRRCRCRWTFLTLTFCALKMRRRRTSFDPCSVVFSSSTVAYVHCWCRLTMNLTMTKAGNLAASATRHCFSYCGRFSGILRIRPWCAFLWASSRFLCRVSQNCRWIKFLLAFLRGNSILPLCLAIEIFSPEKPFFFASRRTEWSDMNEMEQNVETNRRLKCTFGGFVD